MYTETHQYRYQHRGYAKCAATASSLGKTLVATASSLATRL